MSTVIARRAAVVGALAGAAVLAAAGTASAHVTVNPQSAAKGSYTEVSFRAPNEEDAADTTKLQVFLPTDHPIASVATEPVPGWTVSVRKTKLSKPLTTDDGQVTEAVTEITWSGGKIAPGQFQDFPVSLGPLPSDAASLPFKALQTYSNGQVTRWIEVPQPGQAEPANPAPVLQLTSAASSQSSQAAGGSGGSSGSGSGGQASAAGRPSGADTTARTLGIVGIVVGVIGALLGFFGWRRGGAGRPGSTDR
ncbi:YcnI family protein [Phaeacidiphilus oryzae]|uniref:YcnI family protein n=1 Tax=Phaeacidiphilus oryzae TaxID=348818 RepID=UPI00068AD164|nr:YcnI family protein [Phaeacidiphilus oryzae]